MSETTLRPKPDPEAVDACPLGECVWQVIEETPDGVVVECMDCGAEGITGGVS